VSLSAHFSFLQRPIMSASSCVRYVALMVGAGLCAALVASAEESTVDRCKSMSTELVSTSAAPDGKELFTREWLPNDSRAHGGDGLGPVFNESSCVSCHNQGGSGGGGVKNVDIITAFANPANGQRPGDNPFGEPQARSARLPASILTAVVSTVTGNASISTSVAQQVVQPAPRAESGEAADAQPQAAPNPPAKETKEQLAKRQREELAKIHPGFVGARSVVLHRFSTDPKYEAWRQSMLGMGAGQFQINAAAASFDPQSAEAAPAAADAETAQPAAVPAPVPAQPAAAPADQLIVAARTPANPPPNTFRATRVSGTLVLSGTTTITRNVTVQPAQAAANDDFHISVTNESRDADQQIQQLRSSAQMNRVEGLQAQVGNFAFVHSRRNATSLFGVGLIDKIPDSVLISQAKQEHKDFPEIKGRVAKLADGKLGRFGWKAQKASLYDFAMTACAIELGLDVPDHPQAGMPLDAKYKAKGHDMDQAECDSLVTYLEKLPSPARIRPAGKEESDFLAAGEKHFAAVGCADCHAAKLGEVAGIYSDLLLHDMGPDLGDAGSYGTFVPDAPEEDDQKEPIPSLTAQRQEAISSLPQLAVATATAAAARNPAKIDREKVVGALRQEWRTPPLWGVRDSAPYLHDGRASTLEEAIAFHGGEATGSAKAYFMLKPTERLQVLAFLKSLTAPVEEKYAAN
jgi:CxxC motif-containing protein (DUF1111 family)